MRTKTDYTFSEENGRTIVNIKIYNESLERLEKMIKMGFTEGFKNVDGQFGKCVDEAVEVVLHFQVLLKTTDNKKRPGVSPGLFS